LKLRLFEKHTKNLSLKLKSSLIKIKISNSSKNFKVIKARKVIKGRKGLRRPYICIKYSQIYQIQFVREKFIVPKRI